MSGKPLKRPRTIIAWSRWPAFVSGKRASSKFQAPSMALGMCAPFGKNTPMKRVRCGASWARDDVDGSTVDSSGSASCTPIKRRTMRRLRAKLMGSP